MFKCHVFLSGTWPWSTSPFSGSASHHAAHWVRCQVDSAPHDSDESLPIDLGLWFVVNLGKGCKRINQFHFGQNFSHRVVWGERSSSPSSETFQQATSSLSVVSQGRHRPGHDLYGQPVMGTSTASTWCLWRPHIGFSWLQSTSSRHVWQHVCLEKLFICALLEPKCQCQRAPLKAVFFTLRQPETSNIQSKGACRFSNGKSLISSCFTCNDTIYMIHVIYYLIMWYVLNTYYITYYV